MSSLSGTVVGVANATDPDGDELFFSLVGNTGPFSIDATNGSIYVNSTTGPLNFEAVRSHNFTVLVRETVGRLGVIASASVFVTLAVLDVGEAPRFANSSSDFTVDEESQHPGRVL